MNYNNDKDNLYGMKPINEKSCKPYPPTNNSHSEKIANEYNHGEECYDREVMDSAKHCACTNVPSMNHPNTDCNCKPTCNSDCNDVCKDDCPPAKDACCTPAHCKMDPCKVKCICTYMDVLYSEGCAQGTTSFNTYAWTPADYVISAEYTSTDKCCTPCAVDDTSTFTVESSNVIIKRFSADPNVVPANITVNGRPVLSVDEEDGGYTAVVDPEVLNDLCTCKHKGTKGNILINGIGSFTFVSKYILCGKVTTNGVTCNFKITLENRPGSPSTTAPNFTFVDPDICLPPSTKDPVKLSIKFEACAQLVNPTIVTVTIPGGFELNLNASLMLNTSAEIAILKNSKVCFNGTAD